ncbi:hypothetical protein L3Q82_001791 [Scortum barcoo]|uniref:Uncharacterized protein n=1 Tax=Scortum barcoo TaxID=214431 RepID=A0ACB8W4F6_9TELE|nr:hypothetical protein L3Q82_001791 [Scortum barcoo]
MATMILWPTSVDESGFRRVSVPEKILLETKAVPRRSGKIVQLRRKLFLDGQTQQASYRITPSTVSDEVSHQAQGSHTKQERPSLRDEGGGQFSSSPIQHGRFRDCSLGSIASPLFPDRSSPAGLISPTISPIVAHIARTPIGSAERKQPSNVTPHGGPLHMEVPPSNESPFVEGCSPIRSCSPHQLYCHSEHQHNARPKPPAESPLLGLPSPHLPDPQS